MAAAKIVFPLLHARVAEKKPLTIMVGIVYIFLSIACSLFVSDGSRIHTGGRAVRQFKLRKFIYLFAPCIAALLFVCLFISPLSAGSVTAKVNVIIEKLPILKQEKMKDFHIVIKNYIESVEWLEEDDRMPIEISLQLFLTERVSNVEDRYTCEFLISSTDVQYFDKRVRFAYEPGDALVYNEQSVDPLTGVVNLYVNMVLGSELDKYRSFGGDVYYKRARNFAALGKFVRTEFIRGSTEREELVQRVFVEPFVTFRKMKDYYFYGLYALKENNNKKEARKNIITALDLLQKAKTSETKARSSVFDEPKQFLDAHSREIINLFKDYSHRNDVFKKLIELDPDHKELYEEHFTDS